MRSLADGVLVPSGWGDAHWCFLKLMGAKSLAPIGEVPIWVYDEGRPRIKGFVESIPGLKFSGYWDGKLNPMRKAAWSALTTRSKDEKVACYFPAESVFAGPTPFAHVMAMNSMLERGLDLDREIMPGVPCAWRYLVRVEADGPSDTGELIALFPDHGPYQRYLASPMSSWPHVAEVVAQCADAVGAWKVVVIGREWDAAAGKQLCAALREPSLHGKKFEVVNVVEQTTEKQLIARLYGARMVVGFPSGVPFVAAHLGTPVLTFWGHYWEEQKFWVNHAAGYGNYAAMDWGHSHVREAVRAAARSIFESSVPRRSRSVFHAGAVS